MAATIYDVAKKAGVSTATVSKVLSNTPYVSTQTRAKVLAAVEDLGYVPNLAARSLSKARTSIIGLLIPYSADTVFADPHVLELIRGIEEEVGSRGYGVLLSTAGDGGQVTGQANARGNARDMPNPVTRHRYAQNKPPHEKRIIPAMGGHPMAESR